ncbi:MAG: ABC transporter permease [Bacteroidales bacterium]|nr:ABC transporter permease [Bacteroidales bacterium]
MFSNYLKIIRRNIIRQKGFYLINVLGLSVGIACSILIMLFVNFEMGFDKYHAHHNRIYRMAVDAVVGNTMIYQTYTPAPLPEAMYREFPEIEKITRISGWSEVKTRYGDKVFSEDRIFCVDSTFFEVFSFHMLQGDKHRALKEPYSIVLTRTMAGKYFGDRDPLNEVMRLDTFNFKVTGVIEDVPDQSHFHFDFLVPLISFDGFYNGTSWSWNNFRAYLLLSPHADYRELEAKFPDFVRKYMFEGNYSYYDEMVAKGDKWEYYLQPLTDIHLNSDISGEFEANGNRTYINIFRVVAAFILVMACVNFMNLSTAKSTRRAREVGIRKVSGATRPKLVTQFISESIIIAMIGLLIGLLLAEISMPAFRHLTGRNLSLQFLDDPWTIPLLLALAVCVGIFSGSYPAAVLSSFQPVSVLKGGMNKSHGGWSLRNVLVVFQFAMSVFLLIGTMVVYQQLRMVQNKNLGFVKENVLVIRNAYLLGEQSASFKNELLQHPDILHVAGAHRMPGMRLNNNGFHAEGLEDGFSLNLLCCDPGYDSVMQFEMVQGRFFSRDFPTDSGAVVINEAALHLIGWNDPIGKKIDDGSESRPKFPVIGVVRDFHYESMHEKIRPQAFMYMGGTYSRQERFIALRITPGSLEKVIRFLENKWSDFSMELPFSYSVFEEDYNNLYRNEEQTRNLMVIFTILAIFIACLGLLGLASFMATQKTREIGIRKTFGATSRDVVYSFTKAFAKWVLIANVIAWPVAWFAMDRWLQHFEFRVAIAWWVFIVAALAGLVIAVLSVGYQSLKASWTHPVKALRYE